MIGLIVSPCRLFRASLQYQMHQDKLKVRTKRGVENSWILFRSRVCGCLGSREIDERANDRGKLQSMEGPKGR